MNPFFDFKKRRSDNRIHTSTDVSITLTSDASLKKPVRIAFPKCFPTKRKSAPKARHLAFRTLFITHQKRLLIAFARDHFILLCGNDALSNCRSDHQSVPKTAFVITLDRFKVHHSLPYSLTVSSSGIDVTT